MIVQCGKCDTYYDDEFRFTFCPHDAFPANDGKNNFVIHDEAYRSKEVPDGLNKDEIYISPPRMIK